MKYDFDTLVPRRGSACCKWDTPKEEDVIPMWVADMDFKVAPCIAEALQERASHPIYGYTQVPASYYEAIINWFWRRHGWRIKAEHILYTTSVIPATAAALKAMTLPGEKVLIQSPAYNHFYTSIANAGCKAEECALRRKGDSYEMDFEDFERKCSDERVTVFLLCNPHNPSGRVWTRQELLRMKDCCLRHGVRIISDEIHCELVMPGYCFTPMATLCGDCLDEIVCLNSPSKAFNIAGLKMANVVCSDRRLRLKIDRAININEVCDLNPFGITALQAAYNAGAEWLDELNVYLFENYKFLKDFFTEKLPCIEVLRLEGTYLVWVNISATGKDSEQVAELLLNEAKVMVCPGSWYGAETGRDYLRINIACPRALLSEALERIASTLASLCYEINRH